MKKSKGERLNWKSITEVQQKPKNIEGKQLSEDDLKKRGNKKKNFLVP